jgi:hypothetical protein
VINIIIPERRRKGRPRKDCRNAVLPFDDVAGVRTRHQKIKAVSNRSDTLYALANLPLLTTASPTKALAQMKAQKGSISGVNITLHFYVKNVSKVPAESPHSQSITAGSC